MPTAEKTFQGLKLLSSCGGGAYGEVWYCEDLSGRRMAVKIVSKTRLGDAWKRELQGVINYRRITENSPCLLRIFHVAEDGENFYYTMEAADSASDSEYVPDTLARRLQSGPLPPEQLYPVLAGIFNGLTAIHQAGFAHRDIKPDNIIFVGGVPKLSDIGLVSSLSNSLTRLAGTLDFLPPEERSGDTGSTDRASRQRNDLYAFGKVVYCAATGLEPGRYPSLPTNADLSLELKLFLRLAFKLCARDSHLRITDLDGLYREMERIGRQLESGETVADKLRYAWECLSRGILAGVLGLRRTWWVFVLMWLLFGGVMYYLWQGARGMMRKVESSKEKTIEKPVGATKPEPTKKTVETPAPKIKEYSIASLGLKMRIPNHWQAMSEEHIRAQVDEMTRELNETTKDENAKKLLRHAIEKAKTWKGMIRCDLYDAIEISRIEAPADQLENLWTLPDAELKRMLMAQYEALQTKDAEVYGIGRMMLAGRRCVVFDFTLDRKERIKNCMLTDDSGVTVIALTADAATFGRRVGEFDAALKTLEFTTPQPKYEKTKPPPKPVEKPKPPVEPPIDPSTRLYVNRDHGFTMRVPLHWEQMSRIYIAQLLSDHRAQFKRGGKNAEMDKLRLEHLQNILNNGGAYFRCDIDPTFNDDLEIAPLYIDTKELWNSSDEDIRGMFQLEADKRSMPVAFYAVGRAKVAGRDALVVESSNRVDTIQSLSYMILISDSKILTFALSAKRANYAKRKKEFAAALKTLKFTAPAPGPISSTPAEKSKFQNSTSNVQPRKEQTANRSSVENKQRNRKKNTTSVAAMSKKKTANKKPLLEWMREKPTHRKLAVARIKELKKKEAQNRAGKFIIDFDPGRTLEEKLWKEAEELYQKMPNSNNTDVSPVSHTFLNVLYRIENIRKEREKVKAAASKGKTEKQPVLSELAECLGWENYQLLLRSPRYGKIIREHEAEVVAKKERWENGIAEPEPDSDLILEKNLWERFKKPDNTMDSRLYILDHIEYVRQHLGQDREKSSSVPPKGSKKLINEYLKASLYIPKEWIIAFPDGRDPTDTSDNDFAPEQLNDTQQTEYKRTRWSSGIIKGTLIAYGDLDKEWSDTIYMRKIDIPTGDTLFRMPLKNNERRTRLAGRCCVITTYSEDSISAELRLLGVRPASFCIDNGYTCIGFTLYAKKATFSKRMQELEAAIKTMKFEK